MNSNNHLNHSQETPELSGPINAESATPATPVVSLVGVVPEHLLDKGEIVILAVKPSLWFILFRSARVLLLVFALLLLMPYLQNAFDVFDNVSMNHLYQIAAIIVVFQATIAFLQWLSRLYVLTNRRIMRIKGVLHIDVFEAPLTRIQNTYMTFALHERLIGLGSIRFATAGTGLIEASWLNIYNPLEVHEIIRRAIQQAQRSNNTGGL